MKCLEKNLKIGVGDVMITHASHGLEKITDDWRVGEQYYLNNYGK